MNAPPALTVPADATINELVLYTNNATATDTDLPANTAPAISAIANQTIAEDAATATLGFAVDDAQTAADALTITSWSSNPSLIPVANITLGGSGASRTVRATSATNQNGVATISLTVSDAETPANLLALSAISSDRNLINPDSGGVVFSGSVSVVRSFSKRA